MPENHYKNDPPQEKCYNLFMIFKLFVKRGIFQSKIQIYNNSVLNMNCWGTHLNINAFSLIFPKFNHR